MSLGGWGLANPAGLWWALLAIPIVLLHVLRPRRIQAQVAATYLWRQVARPVTAARPWQRLVPSWLLAAQLLVALLLAVLLAEPVRITDAPLADHTIFVIDASGSMQASDGTPTRFDAALDRARELREQLPAGGRASIVVAGLDARAVLTQSRDRDDFVEALDGLSPSAGAGDLAGAFALAAGLDTGEGSTVTLFVSDGGVADADVRAAPTGTRYERVGSSSTNRGITRISAAPSESGMTVQVTVAHHGGPPATQPLRIDVDGITVATREVVLGAGDVANLSIPVPSGELIEAFLEGEDALALDDRAVATVTRRATLQVLVAGTPNVFLDAALAAIPGLEVTRVADLAAPVPPEVDVVVADRVAIPDTVEAPVLAIAPPGGARSVAVTGEVTRPPLTLIRAGEPLLQDLDLAEVFVGEAQRIEVSPLDDVLLAAEGAPLLVAGADGDLVYLAFPLDQSTLPLQVAFPVLVDRALADLAGAALAPARIEVGEALPIDPRLEATVASPTGTSETIAPGSSYPSADRVGFWRVEQPGRPVVTVAVGPSPSESRITPVPDLPFAEAFEGTRERADTSGERPWLWPVVLVLVALVAAEWLLARRRRGVGIRQWRLAASLRAAVAVALLAVLLDPAIDLSGDDVGVVFVLDASDSMGADGRAAAAAWVAEAVASAPEGSRAGVVVFGGDARLEALVRDDPAFSGVTVEVDGTATDIAAALRLAAAALPENVRGRLVVVSDGRATGGDVSREIERLGAEGVPTDVVVIDPAGGGDVAVAAIESPAVVRDGEAVEIVATIESAVGGDAEVALWRLGELLQTRTVTLEPGATTVVFTDEASDEGLLRYQVEVRAPGDRVAENDVGFAGVTVEGAQRVLVVEGRAGAADAVVAGLEATALPSDRIAPDEFPALDELTRYASIVLVDVDRRDLGDGQLEALGTAVRDLGRGMVVLGGTRSYALGGYRDSPLEDLLPVISEITDPLRRQTVAQVLAIDTSGSMAACHCDEEGQNGLGGGNRLGGGVSKTSIARNAAARAIAALAATDEVGVLSMDADDEWVIDLQASPPPDVVDDGLARLVPDGPTFIDTGMLTAAEALRESNASLKHIIFFSDGFTEPAHLARATEQAAMLAEEGITVSVVATGEGAAADLEPIAEAGGGRFYPGRNLEEIPDLIVQEAVLASRDFVNEGEFAPVLTSNAPVVATLDRPRCSAATSRRPRRTPPGCTCVSDPRRIRSWRRGRWGWARSRRGPAMPANAGRRAGPPGPRDRTSGVASCATRSPWSATAPRSPPGSRTASCSCGSKGSTTGRTTPGRSPGLRRPTAPRPRCSSSASTPRPSLPRCRRPPPAPTPWAARCRSTGNRSGAAPGWRRAPIQPSTRPGRSTGVASRPSRRGPVGAPTSRRPQRSMPPAPGPAPSGSISCRGCCCSRCWRGRRRWR
jgi:Mg-chelatase subunit ChlD